MRGSRGSAQPAGGHAARGRLTAPGDLAAPGEATALEEPGSWRYPERPAGSRPDESGFGSSPLAPLDWILLATLVTVPVALATWLGANLTAGLSWDEQWRAYFATLPGLTLDLHQAYSPTSPAWLLLERLAFLSLGRTALALRIPEVAAWITLGVAAYLLARRVLDRPFAYLLGLALVVNPATIYYATEMKPYIIEAAVTVGLLLVWARAQTARRRWPWYVGMAVLTWLSIPAIFIAAPLLAIDAAGVLRRTRGQARAAAQALGPVAIAAALIVVPFAALILPQSGAADYGYFGFPATVPAFAADLGSYFSYAWLPTALIASDTGRLISFPAEPALLSTVLGLVVFALCCLGAWHLRRSRLGRVVAWVAGIALALQSAAALAHRWPLGLIRVNLFLLPLIYFLTVAGISWAWTALRRPAAASRTMPRGLAGAVVAATVAVLGYGGVAQARDVAVLHQPALQYRWEQRLDSVVIAARRMDSPGTGYVVLLDGTTTGCMDEPPGAPHGLGWRLYMRLDVGYGHGVPASDTFFVTTAARSAAGLTGWLTRSHFTRLVEYQSLGGTPGCPLEGGYLSPLIRRAGFHPVASLAWPHSGKLTRWFRGAVAHRRVAADRLG
jgi:hypothetical protein